MSDKPAPRIIPPHTPGFVPPPPRPLRDYESCGAPFCLNHQTKPCESCGRIGGKPKPASSPTGGQES